MRKNKIKLLCLQLFGFFFLIAPILAVFIINRDVYFKTAKDSLNITLGALIGLIVLVIVLMGKTQILKGYAGLIVGLIIIYFLNSIIQDLLIIYSAIVVGDTIYRFIFMPLINKYKNICQYQSEQYVKEEAKNQFIKDQQAREEKKNKKLGSV